MTHTTPRRVFLAVLICILTALLVTPLRHFLDDTNIVMLFLLVVVLITVKFSRVAGVTAAFCSVMLFDIFFVEPRFSLSVNDAQYLVTFAVMLAVALIISALTSHLHEQALAAERRAAQSQALYEFAKKLSSSVSLAQLVSETQDFFSTSLNLEMALALADADESLQAYGTVKLNNIEWLMVQSTFEDGTIKEMGHHNDGEHSSSYLPLKGSTRLRGVLVARSSINMTDELLSDRHMLEAVASIVSASVERLHFVDVAQNAQWQVSSERLRSSILSALSHDIRTPLTALYGMADSLHFIEPALPTAALTTADALCGQVSKLNTMVSNLLDMAKLQTGAFVLRREWQPIEEVIGASIHLLGHALKPHLIKVDLAADLPLLHFDAVLMERVFCNLLENAAKYAPLDESPIVINGQNQSDVVHICVTNKGESIPTEQLSSIFELFERGQKETDIHGTGIGLSICNSIVQAHGGKIWAENLADGVAIHFTLPLGVPPSNLDEAAL